ncbi:MAG: class I SAM-dependent methyltransferase [Acidimicrobiales bacterium]|jgi:tRNA (mo5U34)-methyltransferase|nr:class I SAM-dependent methyltransferase [Actinomycetota bacterium]MDA8186018.1 methyltransferase domain-containing protein [Actinomycetota bacterium]
MSGQASIAERAAALRWYHTIDLGGGVVTDGWFDLRSLVGRYGLPERLEGKRALDVGTWDGFWAFEMERRGAEVVAIDIDDTSDLDWPVRRRPDPAPPEKRGEGFRLAREALSSRVERLALSVYDARPEVLGTFDVVFCGSVLVHLRDQVLALERLAALSNDLIVLAEPYDRRAGWLPGAFSRHLADRDSSVVFWMPSARTWRRLVWSAGFDQVDEKARFSLRDRSSSFSVRHVVVHGRKAAAT